MNRILVKIFLVLMVITGVSAGRYFWPTNYLRSESVTINTKKNIDSSSLSQNDSGKKNSSVLPSLPADKAQNDNIPTKQQLMISTVINVGTTTYPLSIAPSTTIYDAMRQLQIDSRQPFLFSAKLFSGMGYFVDEINGIKNNPNTNQYWILFINGRSSAVGASAYFINEGDVINWKYVTPEF
ncbi:MAG: DUF4430 domain-containing protein [Candidatus Magasanikbacteria bacterium]|jgi:hypothetical protein